MAYDPYDRGDNPWRADLDIPRLDMPRTAYAAKPGAGRASATKPAKKKAAPRPASRRPAASWAGRGPEVTAPIAEDRYERFDLTGSPLTGPDRYGKESERLGVPFEDVFPPKVPEMNLNPDERNVPPSGPNTGMLAGPSPGAMVPERSTPVGPAPPSTMPIMNSTANNPALRPPQSTGVDAMLKAFFARMMGNFNSPTPTNPMFPRS